MNWGIGDSDVSFFLFLWLAEKLQYHFSFVILFFIFFFFRFRSSMLNLFKWCGCFNVLIDFIGQTLFQFTLIHLVLTLSSFSFQWACYSFSTLGNLLFLLVCWVPDSPWNEDFWFPLALKLYNDNLWFILDQLLF